MINGQKERLILCFMIMKMVKHYNKVKMTRSKEITT